MISLQLGGYLECGRKQVVHVTAVPPSTQLEDDSSEIRTCVGEENNNMIKECLSLVQFLFSSDVVEDILL